MSVRVCECVCVCACVYVTTLAVFGYIICSLLINTFILIPMQVGMGMRPGYTGCTLTGEDAHGAGVVEGQSLLHGQEVDVVGRVDRLGNTEDVVGHCMRNCEVSGSYYHSNGFLLN